MINYFLIHFVGIPLAYYAFKFLIKQVYDFKDKRGAWDRIHYEWGWGYVWLNIFLSLIFSWLFFTICTIIIAIRYIIKHWPNKPPRWL